MMPRSKELPFVGVAELGYMLDVTRARISQLVAQEDFPEGVELRMGRVWWWSDIQDWAERKGRTLRKLPSSWPLAPEGGVKGAPLTSGQYRKG
jgi:predicted DNA-binding transcriptional regulator AlpA